ncbi:unnamed protein product [Durusdinium trenchii]
MASAKCQFVLGIILVVFLGTWHVSSAAEGTAEVLTPRDNLQIANAEKTCHLANLFLHSLADDDGVAEPIDIHPVDGGKVRKYAASLDYSVNGFHLLATASPRDSCKLDEISESSSAVMLDPGDARNLEIFVLAKHHNIDGLDSQKYLLNVSRLAGSETALKDVHVPGAYFVPGWKPEVKRFTVYLNLEEDLVKFQILKLDNGQAVKMVAELQEVTAELPGRRLQGTEVLSMPHSSPQVGEAQHLTSTLMTTLDVGHTRVVQIQVTSADRSRVHNYYFTVKRPPCPVDRRFFDGQSRRCTDICNEGFYGSSTTGRCTRCIDEQCAVCQGLHCSLCFDGYELQSGLCVPKGSGTGLATINTIESGMSSYAWKHQTLVLVVATSVIVVCLACLTALCHSGGFRHRKGSLLGDDDDEGDDYEYYPGSGRG